MCVNSGCLAIVPIYWPVCLSAWPVSSHLSRAVQKTYSMTLVPAAVCVSTDCVKKVSFTYGVLCRAARASVWSSESFST